MQAGQYIDGRYKIIKPLGSGGMANVYLGRDLILERQVAIKVMRHDFSNDNEENIRRFKREATATTELNHPNIVPVFDVGEDNDYYMVTEYIDGLNLKEYIQEKFPIPYQKVINIMGQILLGVDYAHSRGIIHRDLKPQNILINKKEQALITDFGIAVALSENSITQTNSLLGSVQYISPEQAKGTIASRQSDIYSLGIILYEMLAKDVPFDGESAVSIALQHFQSSIPSLSDLDPDLPQPLENVVIKATAKDPRYRYKTAQEMREDLMTALRPERAGEEKYIIPENQDQHEKTIRMAAINPDRATVEEKEEVVEAEPASHSEPEAAQSQPVKESYYEEPRQRRRRPWWVIGVLLLIGFLVIIFYLGSQPDTVRIPDVKGMTQDQAISALEGMDLVIGEIAEEASEEYSEGEVTRTNPQSNTSVRERSEVDIFISTGQELYTMPDVVGQNFEEVRAQLTDIGFRVEEENEASYDYPVGQVVSQSVAAGEEVLPSETTVVLRVSTGYPSFELRDLTSYSWQGVLDYAQERGLVANRTEEHSDTVSEGLVISQTPAPGTELREGDSLNVVISLGPEEEEEEEEAEVQVVPVTITVPYESSDEEDNQANQVEIYVQDANNSIDSVYRSLSITSSTSLTLNLELEEGETGGYRIIRDGQMIEENQITG